MRIKTAAQYLARYRRGAHRQTVAGMHQARIGEGMKPNHQARAVSIGNVFNATRKLREPENS